MASRGCSPQNIPTDWWFGPKLLQDQNSWPSDIITEPNNETESEAKVIKEVCQVLLEKVINIMVFYQKIGCGKPGELKTG